MMFPLETTKVVIHPCLRPSNLIVLDVSLQQV
jgi:hypothetical protein